MIRHTTKIKIGPHHGKTLKDVPASWLLTIFQFSKDYKRLYTNDIKKHIEDIEGYVLENFHIIQKEIQDERTTVRS